MKIISRGIPLLMLLIGLGVGHFNGSYMMEIKMQKKAIAANHGYYDPATKLFKFGIASTIIVDGNALPANVIGIKEILCERQPNHKDCK